SLLLVVVDVSDAEAEQHLQTTDTVLERLGAAQVPRIVVFNKTDRLPALPDEKVLTTMSREQPYVAVSTHEPQSIAAGREAVMAWARARRKVRQVFVPYALTEMTAAIYRSCRVLESRASAKGTQYLIEGEPHVVDEIARATRRAKR